MGESHGAPAARLILQSDEQLACSKRQPIHKHSVTNRATKPIPGASRLVAAGPEATA